MKVRVACFSFWGVIVILIFALAILLFTLLCLSDVLSDVVSTITHVCKNDFQTPFILSRWLWSASGTCDAKNTDYWYSKQQSGAIFAYDLQHTQGDSVQQDNWISPCFMEINIVRVLWAIWEIKQSRPSWCILWSVTLKTPVRFCYLALIPLYALFNFWYRFSELPP